MKKIVHDLSLHYPKNELSERLVLAFGGTCVESAFDESDGEDCDLDSDWNFPDDNISVLASDGNSWGGVIGAYVDDHGKMVLIADFGDNGKMELPIEVDDTQTYILPNKLAFFETVGDTLKREAALRQRA